MVKTPKSSGMSPIIWASFILSLLLNVSGIASIVDGLVSWVGFFKDFVDMYRVTIREPLSWLVHQVWPRAWPEIPNWVLDIFVIWSGFWIALNAAEKQTTGKTFLGGEMEYFRETPDYGIFEVVRSMVKAFIGAPLIMGLGFALTRWELIKLENDPAREFFTLSLRYYLTIVAAFVVALFLNWQLRKIL